MKFVYFGYDFMLPSVKRLLEDGHELMGIFSFECDNMFNFNTECQNMAKDMGVPFILSRVEDFHIDSFIHNETQLFLSAGYPYKIPPVPEDKAFAVNIHPTYLPHARGYMPIPDIIFNAREEAAGFTAHKMTEEYDAGDILAQKKFTLSPRESVETYMAKIAIRAPDMVSNLIKNLQTKWHDASPQDHSKGDQTKAPTQADRTLEWSEDAETIDRIGRTFGNFGSIARFDNRLWVIFNFRTWAEAHNHTPGDIVAKTSREITIACKDGYVCLIDFQELEP